ncbi:hypothetical protein ABN211_01805 [Proteus terrae]|uniref:hypothetical protein n=1 Tax=Proteus TaxID=583 RepID=UPI0032DADE9E
MKYYLEIRDPDDSSCVADSFESTEPFMSFSVGDTINGHSIEQEEGLSPHLIITEIEHFIFIVGDTTHHKVMLYTKVKK